MSARLFFFVLLLSLAGICTAQQVQWANKVLKVSSEFIYEKAPGQYLAAQALGSPSLLSPFRASATAYCPGTENGPDDQFIRLGFATPTAVQQIAISENYNPGSISTIMLIDTKGESHTVYQNPVPEPLGIPGRLWHVFIDRTAYQVVAIQLQLAVSRVPGYNQIDAVGIADSRDSIKVKINLIEGMAQTGKPENLGKMVNSPFDELCPVISADGSTLYFTRAGDPNNTGGPSIQDIWFSSRNKDGSYAKAQNMGAPLNNNGNNSITSITPDGQTAVLLGIYEANGMSNGVSLAHRNGISFSTPIPCKIKNYYNDSKYGEYCMSANGKVILMAIQRKESIGGKDLYVTFLQKDNSWSEPVSMGPALNTADNETSPFLAADGKTLYFSTAGLPGYGSKDMFISRRLDDTWTNWSEPQNLGPQLNTSEFDAYYSIPASGEYAYFISYENSLGKADIFRSKLPLEIRPLPVILVTGKVFDAKTGKPLQAAIIYESLTTGKEIGIANSDPRDGAYSIALPAGEDYGFLAEVPAYAPISEHLDLRVAKKYREVVRDLALVPLESGAVVVLSNLFFDEGESTLRDVSRTELSRLVKIMKSNPSMIIEIGGHTDNVGTFENNQKLSLERADAVQKVLLEADIPAKRIQTKGYGEVQPRGPNNSPESRQRNRRVEFKVLEI